jgi:hypothetical protein
MVESRRQQPGLEQFLTEEVRSRDYADVLIKQASAAGAGTEVPAASGNAYHVAFNANEVVIEHHYLDDWPALRLSRQEFITALTQRRAALLA